MMSPLVIVGMLALLVASPARGDVKHVLEGSAHPSAINDLASNLANSVSYSSEESLETAATAEARSGEFWWMKGDSPLKNAHDYYKKCSQTGNCITPVSSINDLSSAKGHLSNNPFLNGAVKGGSVSTQIHHQNKVDLANNPFFTGKISAGGIHSGNGATVHKGSGFIGVQPAAPFGKISCTEKGYVCVLKDLCNNGLVEDLATFKSGVTQCDKDSEVCCRLPSHSGSVKVSAQSFQGVPEINLGSSATIIGSQSGINPSISFAGESGQFPGPSTNKPVRQTGFAGLNNGFFGSSTPDYSNVNIDSNVRFGSSIKGPDYLPPLPDTTPTPISCPSGQQRINGVCQCAFGTVLINGRCETPRPPPKPKCLPGQQLINNQCQCAFGTVLINGRCETPKPTCPPGQQLVNGVCREPTNQVTILFSTPTTTTYDNTGDGSNEDVVKLSTARPPRPINPNPNQPIDQTPSGCAAALKCVQEIYCTAEGFISPVPVVLSKEQESLRAPTTACRDVESGIVGKCCRDPNYKDPWPSANLVNGVDNGQYREDPNLGQYFVDKERPVRSGSSSALSFETAPGACGTRNKNSSPQGPGPIDMDFAEIPWQAMVLRDSNRSLLCGGAIIRRDAVLTSAHCVEGLDTSDVLIKGGEWKLGIDEEPLPFQIVKVKVIVRHPEYRHGSNQNDLAILILEEKLRLAKNIGTICLPKADEIPTQNCIATGWGKTTLQIHLKGAIMHGIDVNVLDSNQCKETLTNKYQSSLQHYNPNTICGFSKIDQCQVDYGSALACTNNDGRYTLAGIFSWDTGCKDQGQIGGYVAPDVAWIDSCLNKPVKELKRLESNYLEGHH